VGTTCLSDGASATLTASVTAGNSSLLGTLPFAEMGNCSCERVIPEIPETNGIVLERQLMTKPHLPAPMRFPGDHVNNPNVDESNRCLRMSRGLCLDDLGLVSLSLTEIQMAICSCGKEQKKGSRMERQQPETEDNMSDLEEIVELKPAFTITIGGAYGLRDSDPVQGKPDCYCLVKSVGRELHRTGTVQNSLSPTWNEEFDVFEHTEGDPLEFRLYESDEDSVKYLGRASLPCASFATQGFNGDVWIQEAKRASGEAYLRLKIKVLGMADYPPNQTPREFTMAVKRGPQHKAWGLDLSSQLRDALFVEEVRPGPFRDANEKAGVEAELRRFDFILSVNDAVGDSVKMMESFGTDDEVVLRVRRPTQRALVIKGRRPSQPLGLVFLRGLKGQALVVARLDAGFFLEWNNSVADEDCRIRTGDHIIAVEGRRGKAHELVAQLEKASSFQLSVVRPAATA